MKFLYLAAMVSVFTFMSCKTSQKSMPSTGADTMQTELLNTQWKLIELNGRKVVNPIPNQKVADIKLMPEGTRLVGSGGCNAMMGTYILKKKNKIKFSAIAMTKMACPDMSIETELGQVFSATNQYAISGKILTLRKGKKAPLAKFEAQ